MVLKAINLIGLPLDRLVGVCTDGATSMLGCHTGFVTQLAVHVPWIISIHCIAHRCALVLSSKSKHFTELKKIDRLLTQVHSLFAHSAIKKTSWATHAKKRGLTRLKFPLFNKTCVGSAGWSALWC